ncbi:MAG TPA: DHA2 family efflux MFS transporter permease subunit [Solirubrobacteraceae bacterium]|jgi:EmrB/QacA subfamily drug resistance transporter
MADTAYGMDPALKRLSAVVLLGAVMTILDTTIVAVAINDLGRDFAVPVATIQWVATGYLLALSLVIPLTGWAIERFGARTLWFASLGLFLTGSVLSGAAWSAGSLIAFRVLQGIGGGIILPVGQTMLARAAGPQRMGRVMSVVAVPALLGPVLGPVIGGLLIDAISWRWIFYVNVPIGVVALLAAWRWLEPDPHRRPDTPIDGVGVALLSPGLAAFVYGVSEAGTAGLGSTRAIVGMVAGALLVAAFVIHALRTRHPLLDMRLFGDRVFGTSSAAMFLFAIAMFAVMILFPLYEQSARGLSALDAGLMMAPQGLAAMVAMPLAGKLTDTRGPRTLVLIGAAAMLLGTIPFTQISADSSQALLAVALVPRGIGMGFMMAPLMAAAYRTLSTEAVPRATTTMNIVTRVGGAVGTALFAVLLQHELGHAAPGAGAAHAFAVTFWWNLLPTAAVALVALRLPRDPAHSAAEDREVELLRGAAGRDAELVAQEHA